MNKYFNELCLTIFNDIKNNYKRYSKYGFNFSYSQEVTWSLDTNILILTLNPQAKISKNNYEYYVPKYPYPNNNIFFDTDKSFKIKDKVLGLLFDINIIYNKYVIEAIDDQYLQTKIFAEDNILLSSIVPFRTSNKYEISKEAWEFSKNRIWKRIFNIFIPEIIITLGYDTFVAVDTILSNYNLRFFKLERRLSEFCNNKLNKDYKFRINKYINNDDKVIKLFGLPHPTGTYGYCGYYLNFKNKITSLSPIGRFLYEYM